MEATKYVSTHESGFYLDFSYVDFPEKYLQEMSSRMQEALSSMKQLEGGAIANPDENRMVGHY